MVSTIALETALLFAARLLLVLGCRKYLLKTGYLNLNALSDDVELDELPTPSTHKGDSGSLHSTISRTVFSWTFAECCMMFILLVLQGMNTFSPRGRLMNWHFSLFSLVGTILVVIPACVSFLLSLGSANSLNFRNCCGSRAVGYFVSVLIYLMALSYIPLPVGLHSPGFASNVLARLIVLGTVILGVLSGFGAINNSWPFIPVLSRPLVTPTDAQIQAEEYTLSSVRNDLRQRRQQFDRPSNRESKGSWLSRVGATFRGGDDMSQEIRGLEALEYQIVKKLEVLRQRRDDALRAKTLKGRLWQSAGRLFAIYCITRIFSCLYNVVFLPSQRSTSTLNYSDILSNVLAYGVSHLSSMSIEPESIASVSRQLSLALVGLIIVTSVRYVLRGAARVLHISSRSMGASLMLLFLAQIMVGPSLSIALDRTGCSLQFVVLVQGIYLLSTIVQMRTSFPPSPTASDDVENTSVNLFSTIPKYELFGSLFDWAFLFTAVASGVLRWGAEKVNGVGDD